MIYIDINQTLPEPCSEQTLISAAEAALRHSGVDDRPTLTIRITDDTEIRELNQRYRGLDSATDVLSFSADFEDPDLENRYLGDVVISWPTADHQARSRGHSTEQELQLLVVHGVLHLLGYDHLTADDKNQMWSLQDRVLKDLGVSIQVEDGGEQ